MVRAAYLLQLERDPELEARMDRIIAVIGEAQEPNGYLYPSHTTGVGTTKNMMGDQPYSFVVHSHELYNMGHLYEAAVAYYETTGKDALLKIAEKTPNTSTRYSSRVIRSTTTANLSCRHPDIRNRSWRW